MSIKLNYILKCINCRFIIQKRWRRPVSSLPPVCISILKRWKAIPEVPEDAQLCLECSHILYRLGTEEDISAERILGHTHVCMCCGFSLRQHKYTSTIRHFRYEPNDPFIRNLISLDSLNEVFGDHALICRRCVQRHQRAEHKASIVQNVDEDQHEDHQEPGQNIEPFKECVTNQAIHLDGYKWLCASQDKCIFEGCCSRAKQEVPILVVMRLLKKHKFYIPKHSKVCKSHLEKDKWQLLMNSSEISDKFTADVIEEIFSMLKTKYSDIYGSPDNLYE